MPSIRDLIHKIFYGAHGEAMRYLFFGVLNVIVTWAAYAGLVLAGIDPNISNGASWVIGVIFAFVVNKFYVFNSRSVKAKTIGREFASFTGARIFTGIICIIGFPILRDMGLDQSLFGVEGFVAKIVVSALEVVLNYFFSKYLIFVKLKGRYVEKDTKDKE